MEENDYVPETNDDVVPPTVYSIRFDVYSTILKIQNHEKQIIQDQIISNKQKGIVYFIFSSRDTITLTNPEGVPVTEINPEIEIYDTQKINKIQRILLMKSRIIPLQLKGGTRGRKRRSSRRRKSSRKSRKSRRR